MTIRIVPVGVIETSEKSARAWTLARARPWRPAPAEVTIGASPDGELRMSHPAHRALIAVIVAAWAACGWAQKPAYPTKAIRLVIPVAPGGNQDITARAVTEPMARSLGQPLVVESRPGSSAVVGTRFVKAAPADGYTLLCISNTFV